MDRFLEMRIFVAVAEEQGFAAAARRLQLSPPAVTRAIASLEASLGVLLLNRTTRSVRVTEPGQRYLEDARRILSAVESADDAVSGINASPTGRLSITAPSLFGRMHVLPAAVEYLRRYPNTEVYTLFVDRVVNLVEEGFDVGVRIGELPDSTYRALNVGEVNWLVVAAPEYLHEHGVPQSPQALREHTIIASSAGEFQVNWRFKKEPDNQVRLKPRLQTSTNDAAIEAAVGGLGITRVLSYQVAEDLASGRLQTLLEDYQSAPLPVNIVHRLGRYETVRIRTFIDLLVDALRENGGF